MNKVVSAQQCDPELFLLEGNRYYTPDGNASLQCGGKIFTLAEAQASFGNEKGSTGQGLPEPSRVIEWARELIAYR
jgi:hypothetical protein